MPFVGADRLRGSSYVTVLAGDSLIASSRDLPEQWTGKLARVLTLFALRQRRRVDELGSSR